MMKLSPSSLVFFLGLWGLSFFFPATTADELDDEILRQMDDEHGS